MPKFQLTSKVNSLQINFGGYLFQKNSKKELIQYN